MIVVLDTNAYADWRRKGHWNEVISRADKIIIPAIVLGELRAGFMRGSRAETNFVALERFLSHGAVEVGVVDDATSRHYAVLKEHLRKAGTPIPEADVWIAAVTLGHAALLLTRDRHFENLPQVRVSYRESDD